MSEPLLARVPVCLGCAWDHYKQQYDTTMVQKASDRPLAPGGDG